MQNPLALLSVARSPSRFRLRNRWWAFTPPFHPLPYHTAGLLSVAVVVTCPLPAMRPHLRFRGATSQQCCQADTVGESREVPLPTNRRQRRLHLPQTQDEGLHHPDPKLLKMDTHMRSILTSTYCNREQNICQIARSVLSTNYASAISGVIASSGRRGPSTHTSPSDHFSFFQMGTMAFRRSIA